MSHRPRTRLLLLTAAVSALALMPPAHADGLRFTYAADQLWYSGVYGLGESALEPTLGPVTLTGWATFRPSGRSFQIMIDDTVVPDGMGVPVVVSQTIGKLSSSSRHCVPVRRVHRIPVAANATVWLMIQGASYHPWRDCGAPATAGTAEISWG